MAPCIQKLVAFILYTCTHAAVDTHQPTGWLDSDRVNEVSMLQSAFKIQASPAGQSRLNRDIPIVVLDLDAAPEVRWKNVTAYWVKLGVLPLIYNFTQPADEALVRAMKVDDEYMREMKGIIADLGLPPRMVDNLLFGNVGYELSGGPVKTGCSGLLVAMPNGTVVHGRNMDFGGNFPTRDGRVLYLPDVLVQVLFMRGGKPLYTSVQWPGYTGIHTAMRFGGWSFEQNTRFHDGALSYQYGLKHGAVGFELSARKIMETTPDFEAAVKRLRQLDLMAPSYFIVAGPGPYQGAVITMDRGAHKKGTPLLTRLSSGRNALRHGSLYTDWNIVQTNDDLNKKPLDTRRPLEELRLARSTRAQVSPEWVFGEMTGRALYNYLTVYTNVYVPATGYVKVAAHPENIAR